MAKVSLLSLNTWKDEGDWPARMAATARGLAALSPDIVCLQETLRDEARDTVEALAEAGGWFACDAPARGKLRDGVWSTSGVAILSRHPIRARAILDLPTSAADGGRKALRADVETPAGIVRAVSLHLSHLRGAEGAALREVQLRALVDWALDGRPDEGAVALAGDFNALAADPGLVWLFADPGVRNSASNLAGNTTLIGRPGALIDHGVLLASPGWRLADSRIVLQGAGADGVSVSDHAGVMIDLAADKSAA
jgi:endonuclease/exonuclease/phosphatase family metal-dependent hydrolase